MRAVPVTSPEVVVSVSRLANYLMRKLAADPKLRRLGVTGEISGLSIQPNGTIYFDLKDRNALIKCVAWSDAAATFPPLANGNAVVATASVVAYTKKSTYQLMVTAVELEGAGRLHAVYEALKRRLEAEGLFATDRKRKLPAYPFAVALISSRAANGAGDFLVQARELAPHVRIELIETPVQGDAAAPEIERAIERASRADVDLVVLARGGGSYEDLFVFNDERVVRALARCAHPTVSAIGHEADTPLTDFVADHRAATPSTAAQTILPRRADLLRSIERATRHLDRAVRRRFDDLARDLERIEFRSPLAAPERLLHERRQTIDLTAGELQRAVAAGMRARLTALAAARVRLEACNPSLRLSRRRERLTLAAYAFARLAREAVAREGRRFASARDGLAPAFTAATVRRRARVALLQAKLDGRNPTAILARGYAIISVDGRVLRDVATIGPGSRLTAVVARGTLAARVESTQDDDGK